MRKRIDRPSIGSDWAIDQDDSGRMPSLLAALMFLVLVAAAQAADNPAPAGATLTALATFDQTAVPKDADTSQLLFFTKDERIILLDEVTPGQANPWVRGKLVRKTITLANGKVIEMPLGKKRATEGFFPLAYTDGIGAKEFEHAIS